jgi:hypothetical protein
MGLFGMPNGRREQDGRRANRQDTESGWAGLWRRVRYLFLIVDNSFLLSHEGSRFSKWSASAMRIR